MLCIAEIAGKQIDDGVSFCPSAARRWVRPEQPKNDTPRVY